MTPFWVSPENVDNAWPLVLPWIEDALKRSGDYYGAEDIREGCKVDKYQLWIVVDGYSGVRAVIVTSICETPRRKFCQIIIATGDGRVEWQHMITDLEVWAKQNGCDVMKPIAREGWARVLKPMGYRKTHVVLEKDL